MSRRQVLAVLASAAGLTPVLAWLAGRRGRPQATFPVARSDAAWREALTPAQYRILRDGATERPYSSDLNHETREGTFVCAGCRRPLFSSTHKYESGTGWPSFDAPLARAVLTRLDLSWLMIRTEVLCAGCGGHLGHCFADGPRPTGQRYCINGLALDFRAARAS